MYDDDKTRKIYHEMVSDSSDDSSKYFSDAARVSKVRRLNGMAYLMIITGVLILLWVLTVRNGH